MTEMEEDTSSLTNDGTFEMVKCQADGTSNFWEWTSEYDLWIAREDAAYKSNRRKQQKDGMMFPWMDVDSDCGEQG